MGEEELTVTVRKSGQESEWLQKYNFFRMAIVEVLQGETDKEAWQRHLAAKPEDQYANIWVFNRPWLE
jgi:hypothetical protein